MEEDGIAAPIPLSSIPNNTPKQKRRKFNVSNMVLTAECHRFDTRFQESVSPPENKVTMNHFLLGKISSLPLRFGKAAYIKQRGGGTLSLFSNSKSTALPPMPSSQDYVESVVTGAKSMTQSIVLSRSIITSVTKSLGPDYMPYLSLQNYHVRNKVLTMNAGGDDDGEHKEAKPTGSWNRDDATKENKGASPRSVNLETFFDQYATQCKDPVAFLAARANVPAQHNTDPNVCRDTEQLILSASPYFGPVLQKTDQHQAPSSQSPSLPPPPRPPPTSKRRKAATVGTRRIPVPQTATAIIFLTQQVIVTGFDNNRNMDELTEKVASIVSPHLT